MMRLLLYTFLASALLTVGLVLPAAAQVQIGSSNYTTLNSAFAAINSGTHTGDILILINDNTTEPATIVPLAASGTGSANYTSVTIKPTGNYTVSASSATSSRGVIELDGADNITIDGDDPGTAGQRNLTIQMPTSGNGGVTCIRIKSMGAGAGATNVTIKNCNLVGSRIDAVSITLNYGIAISNNSTASVTTGGANNDNVTIEGNAFSRMRVGIHAVGASTAGQGNAGLVIRNNVMGTNNAATNIGGTGIFISYCPGAVIEGNDIRVGDINPAGAGYSSSIMGIELFAGSENSVVRNNNIHDIYQPSTAGWAAHGIRVSSATSMTGIHIYNNFIRDCVASKHTDLLTTIFQNAGIAITVGGAQGLKINNNTIALLIPNTTGTVANYVNACLHVTSSTAGACILEFQNNILINNNTSTQSFLVITNSNSQISGATFNYNAYRSSSGLLGRYNSASHATLADWQTATGKDANSVTLTGNPFVSATDLHIANSGLAIPLNGGGIDVTGITVDIDGDTRLSPPDIGADEFNLTLCSGTPNAGTVTAGTSTLCAGQAGTTLTLTGATTGAGITYQWKSSTTAGGPYTNVGGPVLSPTLATGSLTATTYYVVETICEFGGTATSPEFTVTVNPVPTAAASANSPCAGFDLNLTATTDIGTSFAWAGPGGFTSTAQNPTITSSALANGGTYTVTVTLAGCSATSTVEVTVLPTPAPVAAADPSAVCSGGSSQLSVAPNLFTSSTIPTMNFAATTGVGLVDMTGATQIIGSNSDDIPSPGGTDIGFTFGFNGVNYNQFSVSPDGFIHLKNGTASTTSQFTNNLTSTTNIPKICPYWDDMATGTTGNVFYKLMGTAPHRVLVVQWFVTIPRSTSGAANSTFQALLYEGSNTIEFRYGTMGSASMSASIGLSNGSTFQSVTVPGNTVSTTTANNSVTAQPVAGTQFSFTVPTTGATYAWTPAANLSNAAISNPVASNITSTTTYTVVVTNGSCSSSATVTVSSEALSCGTITEGGATNCLGVRTAVANPTSGGQPYSYAWTANGIPIGGNTASISTIAGTVTYAVTVTDNCGATCSTTAVITTVAPPATPTVSLGGPACSGQSVVLQGTTDGQTSTWTGPGGFNQPGPVATITNASAANNGNYVFTAFNGVCASASVTLPVTVNNSPVISSTTATPSAICEGSTANLSVNLSPTASYCAAGSTLGSCGSDEYISNVTFGSINNNSGCTVGAGGYANFTSLSTTVTAGSTVPLTLSIVNFFSGDQTRVWIDWNQNGVFDASEMYVQTGSVAATTNFSITVPPTASNGPTRMRVRLTYTGSIPPCGNTSFGETEDYTVVVTGGSEANTYAWSSGATTATTTVTPTITTTYTVTVTNAAGCAVTGTTTVSVTPSLTVSLAATNISCNGSNNGSITAVVSGGNGSNTFSWSNSASTATISGLAPGTYTVTVTSGACSSVTSTTITEPAALTAAATVLTNVACFGGNTGSVQVTASGGTSPYTGIGVITGLSAGNNQSFIVTDANGCATAALASITQPNEALSATATVTTNVSCFGLANGSAEVTATGGTSPYTGTGSQTGLTAGLYTFTVSDANGCTAEATVTVSQPDELLLTASNITAPTCASGAYQGTNNGSVVVVAQGGTTPYTGGGLQSNLTAGNYNYTVTDANGCTAMISVVIPAGAANTTYYLDNDGDGYGQTASTILSCTGTPMGYAALSGDCNDNANNIYPGAPEPCGGNVDLNCDGQVGVAAVPPTLVNSSVSGNSVTLTWSGSCATRFRIQLQRNNLPTWSYYFAPGTASSRTITGLQSGTYKWTVRAQGTILNVYTNPTATPQTFTIP